MSDPQSPADELGLVGTTVDGVRFDACVDGGGFGLIYRGHHEGLGETVAIKCLRIASIQRIDEQMREALAGRFRDETKLLYRLSQESLDIVRCIGSGTVVAPKTREYTPYMVLEWLEGRTLSAELRDRRGRKAPQLTLEEAAALLEPAALGLAYAHGHDVVHRDVKPGNLFLARTRAGVRMKVLDFGLAKILSDETIGIRPSVETGVGVHFCSPSYGAPEQFSGRIGKVGPSTDVYSLALVLYEVLLGTKVRPAANLADGLLKALEPKTGSPSASSLGLSLPPRVEALLHRAVAQNPADRPRDAGVFWALLKEAMESSRAAATVVMTPMKIQPQPSAVSARDRGTAPLATPLGAHDVRSDSGSAGAARGSANAHRPTKPSPLHGVTLPIGAMPLRPSSYGPPPMPSPNQGFAHGASQLSSHGSSAPPGHGPIPVRQGSSAPPPAYGGSARPPPAHASSSRPPRAGAAIPSRAPAAPRAPMQSSPPMAEAARDGVAREGSRGDAAAHGTTSAKRRRAGVVVAILVLVAVGICGALYMLRLRGG